MTWRRIDERTGGMDETTNENDSRINGTAERENSTKCIDQMAATQPRTHTATEPKMVR